MRFRRRATVEAIRYDGCELPEAAVINCSDHVITHEVRGRHYILPPGYALIDSFSLTTLIKPGDWFVIDENGHHMVIKPHIFEHTYEPAEKEA